MEAFNIFPLLYVRNFTHHELAATRQVHAQLVVFIHWPYRDWWLSTLHRLPILTALQVTGHQHERGHYHFTRHIPSHKEGRIMRVFAVLGSLNHRFYWLR